MSLPFDKNNEKSCAFCGRSVRGMDTGVRVFGKCFCTACSNRSTVIAIGILIASATVFGFVLEDWSRGNRIEGANNPPAHVPSTDSNNFMTLSGK